MIWGQMPLQSLSPLLHQSLSIRRAHQGLTLVSPPWALLIAALLTCPLSRPVTLEITNTVNVHTQHTVVIVSGPHGGHTVPIVHHLHPVARAIGWPTAQGITTPTPPNRDPVLVGPLVQALTTTCPTLSPPPLPDQRSDEVSLLTCHVYQLMHNSAWALPRGVRSAQRPCHMRQFLKCPNFLTSFALA